MSPTEEGRGAQHLVARPEVSDSSGRREVLIGAQAGRTKRRIDGLREQ